MAVTPFEALTDAQVSVLHDMREYWSDKDRHGELEVEYRYDAAQLAAFYALGSLVDDEARKRRIIYT
jgi:hypothetical protein